MFGLFCSAAVLAVVLYCYNKIEISHNGRREINRICKNISRYLRHESSQILGQQLQIIKAYKLTLVQAVTENDKQLRTVLSVNMLEFLENDDFEDRIVFSDEATFHINGRVNRHNVRIWGSEHPRQIIEHVRDSPKLNVFAAICRRKLYGPFFFAERTVNKGTLVS